MNKKQVRVELYQNQQGYESDSEQDNKTDMHLENENQIYSDGQQSHTQYRNYETFEPHKKYMQIDYDKDVGSYLSEVEKLMDKSQSKYSKKSQPSHEDDQVQFIINQVLKKRKANSRHSALTNPQNPTSHLLTHKTNISSISIVNERLNNQNEQLLKNIKKLSHKIKQMNFSKAKQNNKSNVSNNKSQVNSSSNSSVAIDNKLKEIQKLKQRVEKAEKLNSKMELELSRLEESRKITRHKLKSESSRKLAANKVVLNASCQNCQRKAVRANTRSQSSPLKNNYYSPIMQFQQYNVANEPTISLYDNNFHKTSQFGLNLAQAREQKRVQASTNSWGSQTEAAMQHEEQKQIDKQIMKMEAAISKNNSIIANYQNLFLKQII